MTDYVLRHRLLRNDDGSPTLYLHGFLGSSDDWTDVTSRLGQSFSHLTVDLPGHNMAADHLPESSYAMPACAQQVIDLLDRLGFDQTNLVGYSMGGRLGLYLLANYPNRFKQAVIESASPGLPTEAERTARREVELDMINRLHTQPLDQFLHDWYTQPLFVSMNQGDPRFKPMLAGRGTHDPEALAMSLAHMGTSVQPSLWERLPEVDLPVLYIAGSLDNKYCRIADQMANLCPRAQKAIISGAGHNTHWERPEQFCRVVGYFLTEQR